MSVTGLAMFLLLLCAVLLLGYALYVLVNWVAESLGVPAPIRLAIGLIIAALLLLVLIEYLPFGGHVVLRGP